MEQINKRRGGGGLRQWASCLFKWGELSIKVGRVVFKSGASCLLKVGRVVLGRVLCGASCLGASCLWGELSVIQVLISKLNVHLFWIC